MKTKWYRSTQRRGRALSALLALVLAVGLVLAVPPLDGPALATDDLTGAGDVPQAPAGDTDAAAPEDGALDLTASCSLTLKFPEKGDNVIGSSENAPDADSVTVDLYKIADAVKLPGYQTYQFEIASGSVLYNKVHELLKEHEEHGWHLDTDGGSLHFYYAPDPDDLLADDPRDWSSLVDVLARFCLDESNGVEVQKDCDFGQPIEGLEPGLYLTVVHGAETDFTPLIADNGDQYKDEGAPTAQPYPAWVTEQSVTGASGRLEREGTGDFITTLASAAYDDDYLYLFQPQLVSLPGYAVDSTTTAAVPNNTGWSGVWTGSVTLVTKHTEIPRCADLQIVKQLPGYLAGEGGATFIYEITATRGGTTVYHAVESLSFDGPSRQGERTGVIVDSIPVGCSVTITETYAGYAYEFDPANSGAWAARNTGALPTGNGAPLAGGAVNGTTRSITIPAEEMQPGSIRLAVKDPDMQDSGLGSIRLDVGRTEIAVFSNELGDSNRGGGSVVNRFAGDNTGSWSWTKRIYDPAAGWVDVTDESWNQRVAARPADGN